MSTVGIFVVARWWFSRTRITFSVGVGAIALIIGTVVTEGSGAGNNIAGIIAGVVAVLSFMLTFTSFTKSGSDTGDLIDRLAAAVSDEWEKAAQERKLVHPSPLPIWWCRSKLPVAGPVTAAAGSASTGTRFDPLPGLDPVDRAQLEEGDEAALHTVYGGLGTGRLLLLGAAGSGKSSATVLLLRRALRFREQASAEERARIPVPVMFTLHGWNPETAVTDWLTNKLVESYPIFHGCREHAAESLSTGRVAVFLDGLDEMPENLRTSALTALADAPFRLVISSRTGEALITAEKTILAGAVALELQPIPPDTATRYLLAQQPDPSPPAWKKLTEHLTADDSYSAVGDALDNPLTLSLLRDVYGPTDPVDELLDTTRFPTATDIDDHLLDHAINAAYKPRPGRRRPPCTAETAHRTLRYLAVRMTAAGTRDLAWWHLPTLISNDPTATPRPHPQHVTLNLRGHMRKLVSGLVLTLMGGFTFGLGGGLVFGLAFVSMSVLLGMSQESKEVGREARGPVEVWSQDRRAGVANGLAFGLVAGVATAVAGWLTDGLAGWLVGGLVFGRALGLLGGLLGGLALALAAGLASWLADVLVVGLVIGTFAFFNETAFGLTTFVLVRLAIKRGTPLNLIKFLEDARTRNLLRSVGPLYQFRHADLQDRLASTSPSAADRDRNHPD